MERTSGRLTRALIGAFAAATSGAFLVGLATDHYVIGGGGHAAQENRGISATPAATSQPSPSATVLTVVPPATSAGADHTAEPAGSLPGAPSRVNEFGIPVGYPHTEAGAISACGNYVSAYSDVRNREPSRIAKIFDTIAVPQSAKKLTDQVIAADKKNSTDYGVSSALSPKVNFDIRVAGYTVQSYTPQAASITVWGISSFGVYDSTDVKTAPRAGWGTDACKVQWYSGDWRIQDAGDGGFGPDITERGSESFTHFLYVGAES
jgi:hypothetical protein